MWQLRVCFTRVFHGARQLLNVLWLLRCDCKSQSKCYMFITVYRCLINHVQTCLMRLQSWRLGTIGDGPWALVLWSPAWYCSHVFFGCQNHHSLLDTAWHSMTQRINIYNIIIYIFNYCSYLIFSWSVLIPDTIDTKLLGIGCESHQHIFCIPTIAWPLHLLSLKISHPGLPPRYLLLQLGWKVGEAHVFKSMNYTISWYQLIFSKLSTVLDR